MTNEEWKALMLILRGLGLEISGFNRASSEITVKVPNPRSLM